MTSLLGDSLLVAPDPILQSTLLALDARLDNLEAAWTSYVPVLTASTTNPTLGSGSVAEGRYLHVVTLDLMIVRWFIQFGSSGADPGSGTYEISMPQTLDSATPSGNAMAIGVATLFDWSVAGHKELATAFRVLGGETIGLHVDNATVSHNAPFSWTIDDRMGGLVVGQVVG